MENASFVRTEMQQPLPPPVGERGMVKWLRENLFSGPLNTALTLLSLAAVYFLAVGHVALVPERGLECGVDTGMP